LVSNSDVTTPLLLTCICLSVLRRLRATLIKYLEAKGLLSWARFLRNAQCCKNLRRDNRAPVVTWLSSLPARCLQARCHCGPVLPTGREGIRAATRSGRRRPASRMPIVRPSRKHCIRAGRCRRRAGDLRRARRFRSPSPGRWSVWSVPQAVGRLEVVRLRAVRQPSVLLKLPIGSTSLIRASGRLKVLLSVKSLSRSYSGAFSTLLTCPSVGNSDWSYPDVSS